MGRSWKVTAERDCWENEGDRELVGPLIKIENVKGEDDMAVDWFGVGNRWAS